ncbi:hypothetical protein LTR17_009856 [Elasticomyces elasticus]|nr:hypothetical protein LTR17_009856 [Elasticomyces elasticus]
MPIPQGLRGQSSDESNHNPDNKDDSRNDNDNNNDDNPQAQPPTAHPRVVTLGDMMRQAENNMADPQRAMNGVLADMANLRARITALERTVTVLERDRVERGRRPRTPVRDEMMLDDDARIRPVERRPAERRGMLQRMRSRAIEAGEFEDYAAVSEDERLRQYDQVRRQGYGMFGRSRLPYVMSEERRNERGPVSGEFRDRQMIEERTLVDGDGDLDAQERRTNERISAYEEYRRRALELGVDVSSEELFDEVREMMRRRVEEGIDIVE